MKTRTTKKTKKYIGLCVGVLLALLLTTQIAAADDEAADNKPVDPVNNNYQYSVVIYDSASDLTMLCLEYKGK